MAIIFKKEMREVDVAVDVICDCCKRSRISQQSDYPIDTAEVVPIKYTFGYNSRKDGMRFAALICEECFDEIVKAFGLEQCYVDPDEWMCADENDLHKNGWLNDFMNGRVGQMDLPFPQDGAIEL